ncbi:MAG TPA: hypothetical protein VI621_04415 [Flavobacterium sp.]|nr:hypothetical protein [Flavobacterium sp.]
MIFDFTNIGKGKEIAFKFVDSLPLKSLETIHPIVSELLDYIEQKIGEKCHGKVEKSR